MQSAQFYDILDTELARIILDNPLGKQHKNDDQNKGNAFLWWLLGFYHQGQAMRYVTDGPDDASCDLIFSKKSFSGEAVFYVIQSKWNTRKNITGDAKSLGEEIKRAIADFTAIVNGTKEKGKNERFNEQYDLLQDHLRNNGKVKFIFTGLKEYGNQHEHIDHFNNAYLSNIKIEIFDIQRLKRDYIEFIYKDIRVPNRLEYWGNMPNEPIDLAIAHPNEASQQGNFLRITQPYSGYAIFIRPVTIYKLFTEFGFRLFFKNVRNPLHESAFNAAIAETVRTRPAAFWYFNNGITAIANNLPANINPTATTLPQIRGLQIINGAQTCYSIYCAYRDANEFERSRMDDNALVSMRLISTNDEQFDLEISRYTNSQNPVYDRDFHANDPVQQRLQDESFLTNFWYERRRGEFSGKPVPAEITVLDSETLARAYLVFWLEKPIEAIRDLDKSEHNRLTFKSYNNIKGGLYEEIFNAATTFEALLLSYQVFVKTGDALRKKFQVAVLESVTYTKITCIITALIKRTLSSVFEDKTNINKKISKYILEWDSIDYDDYVRVTAITIAIDALFVENNMEKTISNLDRAFYSENFFDKMLAKLTKENK